MSLLNEYITKLKKEGVSWLETELLRLIAEYNKARGAYLFVYVAAIGRNIPRLGLEQSDYYIIRDLLTNKREFKKIDMYIETPGGSGETAEDIVKFLHNNFETVSFVISGEAKSAGTIMVMSGNEILMTETGSLGPIDAQVKIGRSIISAADYVEWVDEKRKEGEEKGALNPFDATMIAQITPGELNSVLHVLRFAQELVVEWLINYKFKNWTVTETRKIPVTEEMKRNSAEQVAKELINRNKWRSHGRSIKINELEGFLKIIKIDKDAVLKDIVYRIQIVCKLLFDNTSIFKIFATKDDKIFSQAVPVGTPIKIPQSQAPDVAEIDQKCPKCNKEHKIYAKLVSNPRIDLDFKRKGFVSFPKENKIKCSCGFEIDLLGFRNQIEITTGKKILIEGGN